MQVADTTSAALAQHSRPLPDLPQSLDGSETSFLSSKQAGAAKPHDVETGSSDEAMISTQRL